MVEIRRKIMTLSSPKGLSTLFYPTIKEEKNGFKPDKEMHHCEEQKQKKD